MEQKSLIVTNGIYYLGILNDIKKSKDHFKPIYEAFTNALESIKLTNTAGGMGSIKINLFLRHSTIPNEFIFDQIVIEDTGIGFDAVNFERLKKYKDTRKGFFNKGSGRFQFLHFFETAKYVSIYKEKDSFMRRSFTLSKQHINKNAIISDHNVIKLGADTRKTVITLHGLLDKKDESIYNSISARELKDKLISRYMMEFCTHREKLPAIQISKYIDGSLTEETSISADDIPLVDEEREMVLQYVKLSNDGKDFEKTQNQEHLKLSAFKIDERDLEKNEIKLTSKGEIVSGTKIKLENISPTDRLNGKRYLFLISGKYIDERDSDTRGVLNIPLRDDFEKDNSSLNMFSEELIFLDDIKTEANATILSLYNEIVEKKEEKKHDIEKLKSMFLLDEATLSSLSFGLEDNEEKILEKVYSADSKTLAKKDAEIKKCIETLDDLNPSAVDYGEKLKSITSELVRAIPLQNRVSLTHYVARRKLVLDVFDKILTRELNIQKTSKRNIDEKLLHNLIFQQSSSNPEESDLWLLNEDFIYFKGSSEGRLCDIEIEGKKIFKSEFSVEENSYLLSLDENRKTKTPDVLIFPDEGKCIIVEFKNPNVNISDHLNQINKYAFLIRNYSEEQFHFETFYGYLIGESLHPLDVRSCDADFVEAYHFDYLYRPHKNILDVKRLRDGSLYTEVIQYSTLLKRAIRRNEIFIEKLTGTKKVKNTAEKTDAAEAIESRFLTKCRSY